MTSDNASEISCAVCGFQSRSEAKFCGGCAEAFPQDNACSTCGYVNESAYKFCVICGNAIKYAPVAAGNPVPEVTDTHISPPSRSLQWWGRFSFRFKAVLALAAVVVVSIIMAFTLMDSETMNGGTSSGQDIKAPSSSLAGVSGDVLEPNPSEINLRAAPTEHHRIDVGYDRSMTVTSGAWPSNILVHNNPNFLEMNACDIYKPDTEGINSILLIAPEEIDGDWRPFFFVAGCSEGLALLEITSDGEIVAKHTLEVAAP